MLNNILSISKSIEGHYFLYTHRNNDTALFDISMHKHVIYDLKSIILNQINLT